MGPVGAGGKIISRLDFLPEKARVPNPEEELLGER